MNKTCIECLKQYLSRNKPGSQDFAKQKFCSKACTITFRKRVRHRQPHPDAVLAEMERQGFVPENTYDTISFRNLGEAK